MKLMLRPEWRLWPFSSFLGLLDLKTGVTVALLFALFNKVAGVYGLIAVVTGAGGSFAQLSLYIYSVVGLLALFWALRAVKEEDAKHTLYFAHWFFADHIFSTSWTVFFAVVYWFQTPHDGELQINSDAQMQIIEATPRVGHVYTPEERLQAAMEIWKRENGTAFAIIVLSWLSKFYLALLIYSYATHLRKGSYRSLPRSRHAAGASISSNHTYDPSLGFPDEEDEEIEDFYRVPLRTPNTGGSVASFAEFVNAPPGRSRRTKSVSARGALGKPDDVERDEEEVLFDEEELMSQGHSKLGTDESSVSSTTDDERKDRVNRGVRV